MVSIRYPDMPRGVDIGLISDLATQGYERGQKRRDDAQAEKAFGLYLQEKPPQQGMSLAALAPNEVQRAPLADVDPASQRVAQAHNAADPMNAYFTAIQASESGGDDLAKNPNSSAAGRYQFTQPTWEGLMQSNPGLGLTAEGRSDPRQQEAAVRALTAGNARQLSKSGVPVNPSSLYAAHFLGAGGAVNAFAQPDQTPMASVVGPEVIQANPFLGDMTVGDFKGWAAQKAGGSAPQQAAPQQIAQAAPQGGSGLPPREVMLELFKSPQTRPLAIQLAQSAQKLAQGDPMAQVELEKAKLELENLRNPKPNLMSAGDGRFYDPSTKEWITAPGGGDDYSKRKAAADQLGLSPDDPAYQGFILTGKMPREDAQTLTATDKKAILEADELVAANDSALQMLGSVLSGEPGKTLNDRAGSGATAGTQSWLARNDPTGIFDDEKGQATTELQNVVLGQALASLKATFGAAPTEGERKILVDLQASIDKTPAERKIVIGRAMEAAKRRLDFNKKRVDDLRGGSFYKPGGGGPASQPSGNRTTSGVSWSVEPSNGGQ